jgi:hypothetical protein
MSSFRCKVRDLQYESAVPKILHQVLLADSGAKARADEVLVGKRYHRFGSCQAVNQPQVVSLKDH